MFVKREKECVDLCKKVEDEDLLLTVYDDLGMVYNSLGDKVSDFLCSFRAFSTFVQENTLKYFELAHRDDSEEHDEEGKEE